MIIVNPNHRNPSPTSAIEAPIWCAYLARKYGASILDAEAEGFSVEETVNAIGNQSSIVVAMGANPSASSTPKMGVGDELVKRLNFCRIAGLHPQTMTRGRKLIHLPLASTLAGMKPLWNGTDFSKYKAHNWHCLDGRDRGNYGVIYTSFGCPFNCSYCNIGSLYRGVTYREPEDVVDEIADLYETHSVRNLKVCDELFVSKHSHVERICDLLIEKGYDLNIWAYAKVGLVNPRLLEKMKKAGFNWLCYGFESADEDVLKGVGKKQTMKQMFEAVEMTHNAGINVLGNFIFGLPDDNMKTMYATRQLVKQLQCDWVNFYCAMAYPGSQLYKDTPKEDLPDKWEDYDQYSPNMKPLPTKHLTSNQVLEYRDMSFKGYFSDKHYLKRIENKFGEQAVNQIQEMLKWSPRN